MFSMIKKFYQISRNCNSTVILLPFYQLSKKGMAVYVGGDRSDNSASPGRGKKGMPGKINGLTRDVLK